MKGNYDKVGMCDITSLFNSISIPRVLLALYVLKYTTLIKTDRLRQSITSKRFHVHFAFSDFPFPIFTLAVEYISNGCYNVSSFNVQRTRIVSCNNPIHIMFLCYGKFLITNSNQHAIEQCCKSIIKLLIKFYVFIGDLM